jgi:hypothetical protein
VDAFEKAFNVMTGEQKSKYFVIRVKLNSSGGGVEKDQ